MNSRRARARRLTVPGALLLAVSFALVGCSQGTDSAKEGPITSRMNALYGDDSGNEQWQAENERYEEIVATCMKEKGFEYTPVKPDDDAFAVQTWSDEDWDPVADAKENGYYITPASKDALIEQYGLGEVTDDEIVDEDPGSWFADDDPNGAYYRGLSASDQAAYDEALYGPMSDDMEAEYDWTTAGCNGEAFHEVYEAQMDDQEAEQDSTVMDDYYSYADDKLTNDPRVLEASAAWASCMADQGYDFATADEARSSIQQRFDDLTGTDTTSEEWVDPDPSRFSDEEIATLHDDEIALATTDAQCTVDTDMYDVYETVLFDVETEFYNTHKTEVDAWFAAQEARMNKKD